MAIDHRAAASSGPILECVVFDLDGVLTDTASLHQSAWQRLFNEVFQHYPGVAAFSEADYLQYVDGRRRTDGVAAVLSSRGIELAAGDPTDPPDRDTLAGLARRKDDYYVNLLRDLGPHSFACPVSPTRPPSSKQRAVLRWSRGAPRSSKTRSPAWRREPEVDSRSSSGSIGAAGPKRSRVLALARWWPICPP